MQSPRLHWLQAAAPESITDRLPDTAPTAGESSSMSKSEIEASPNTTTDAPENAAELEAPNEAPAESPKAARAHALRFLIVVVVGAITASLAPVGVLTLTRGTPVSYVGALRGDSLPEVGDPLFARSMELYTGTALRPRNRVELLLNGDGTYPALWSDLRAAERTITVQLYYSQPGEVADTMQAILAERARAGVRVLVMLDAFGSGPLGTDWGHPLQSAGARV